MKKVVLDKISNKCLKIALFHFQIGFKEYIQKKKVKKLQAKKNAWAFEATEHPMKADIHLSSGWRRLKFEKLGQMS